MYHIINGGYFTKHPQSFLMERPMGFDHFVFLRIRSEAVLCISNHTYNVPPNSYLFIRPHTPYSYHNPNGSYMDDWIHFDCSAQEIDTLPSHIFHQPFSCNNPVIISTYLEQLLWEKNFAPEAYRENNVHQLFQIILRHVLQDYHAQNTYHPYRFQLQKQRLTMQATPYINHQAGSMAASIGISLSYYEHLYKFFFGDSFRSDLINMRIDYAKDLIKNTNLSLEEIAQKSGYNSEVHFYRQFLSRTGTTPGKFKKMSCNIDNPFI